MATYRYFDIRRDVYEQSSKQMLKRRRSFADMRRLFRPWYWILFAGILICMVASIALPLLFPDTLWWIIPSGGILLLVAADEFFGNRMYNPLERKKENDEFSANLDKYTETIQSILHNHRIVTKEQRDILRKECELQLSIHNSHYKAFRHKVFDMLVGVPLGAFISALIYQSERSDIMMYQLFVIVCFGLVFTGSLSVLKKIAYYSEGHFKDQYLLDALNEVDYLSE